MSHFLSKEWKLTGSGLESFGSALAEFYQHTQLIQVETRDIFLAHMDKKESGKISGKMFTGGLNSKVVPISINEKQFIAQGADMDLILEICEEPDIMIIHGEPYMVTGRAMLDLLQLSNLGGTALAESSPERAVLLSKYLPGVKTVSLVVREAGHLKRVVAVRSEDFTYNPADVVTEICGDIPVGFGIKECSEMKWTIDHSFLTAEIQMDEFDEGLRTNYGMKDVMPFVEVIDCSTGDSSFTVRGGIKVADTKVIMIEKAWQHRANKKENLQDQVREAGSEMKKILDEFLYSLHYISFDFTKYVDKMPEILDYIYKECDFSSQLGKKMWLQTKEATIATFKSMKEAQRRFTGKDVAVEIFRSCPATYLKNSRALANVPAAIEKWMGEEPDFMSQMCFGS